MMKLNYKSFGRGDPLIILHGLFGMLDNWQSIAKRLAEDYSVFIVDQRDHGKSPHTAEINYALMAEDLRIFMEANWLHEAVIIGHSMGGKTAMQFALSNDDMVEKLIVVDIAPKAYAGSHQTIFEALQAVPIDELESRQQAEEILRNYIVNDGVIQFLLKNLKRKKTGAYRWKMNLDTIQASYQNILDDIAGDSIDCPTLFIQGGHSEYIQESDHEKIKSLFPNTVIKKVADAGHWVHAEAPKEVIRLIKAFVEQEN